MCHASVTSFVNKVKAEVVFSDYSYIIPSETVLSTAKAEKCFGCQFDSRGLPRLPLWQFKFR